MNTPEREVYFVGSVASYANASEVFTAISRALGPALRWLPDGETGPRQAWLPWLEPIFSGHPQFEPTGQHYRRVYEIKGNPQYRVKPGIAPEAVRFDNLPFAAIASDSYRDFATLKGAGVVPERVRFQVCLAGVNSVVRRFVVEEHRDAIARRYEEGLFGEIAKMAAAIPADQLAIQWDVASAVFQYIEAGAPTVHGETREEMLGHFSAWHARLGDAVPEGVDLLYHLCYGDHNHRHSIEPQSSRWLVEFANRLGAKSRRRIQSIHMPVPRNRDDEAYFEPLADLQRRPGTELALGLVHHTDGVEGTRRRIRTAEKYATEFMLATECGMGRRDPKTIPRLLEIHAEVAGLR